VTPREAQIEEFLERVVEGRPDLLAALGVLVAAGAVPGSAPEEGSLPRALAKVTVPWRLPPDLDLVLPPERRDELERAWVEAARTHEGEIRIAVHPDRREIPPTLVALLARATRVVSVHVRDRGLSPDAGWQWPLRLGFLRDAASDSLRARIEAEVPHRGLVEIVDVHDDPTCDVLVLDDPAQLEPLRYTRSLDVNFLTVFLPPGAPPSEPPLRYATRAAARAVRASGFGVVPLPSERRGGWMGAFTSALSHNEPLDVAFGLATGSAARPGEIPALSLTVHPKLLLASRVSSAVEVLAKRVQERAEAGDPVPRIVVTPSMRRTLGVSLPEGITPADVVAREYLRRRSSLSFDHESGAASGAADLGRALRDPPTGLAKSGQRFVQAAVYEVSDPAAPLACTGGFVAGAPHRVSIRVGPSDLLWLSSAPFPDHLLSEDQDVHELSILFRPPEGAPAEQKILLPRTGHSTVCHFELCAPAAGTLTAQVLVFHERRILQVLVLHGPVVERAECARLPSAVRLDVEETIRVSLEDLDERTGFDAGLHLRGEGVTGQVGSAFFFTRLDGVEEVATRIGTEIHRVAKGMAREELPLSSQAARKLIVYLAMEGHLLLEALRRSDLPRELEKADRIQLVTANDAIDLPLEFVYERGDPSNDADLCDGFEGALRDGSCASCSPDTPQVSKVCPLGFWGLQKVIERHRGGERPPPGIDLGLLRSEPKRGANRLRPVDALLLAASGKVQAADLASLQQSTQAVAASDWHDWTVKVTSLRPPLLVALPHVTRFQEKLEALELGADDLLRVGSVSQAHVQAPPPGVGPVVLLLGCGTAAPEIPFQSFVSAFRLRRAAVVVATIASVLGRHAAPVAEAFVQELRSPRPAALTFGELMPLIRRRLLADGLVMALALVAYGDTDWRLP